MAKISCDAIIKREISLLSEAVCAPSEERRSLLVRCRAEHERLCARLFRDFITPIAREDLFLISDALCRLLRLLCTGEPTADQRAWFSRCAALVRDVRFDASARCFALQSDRLSGEAPCGPLAEAWRAEWSGLCRRITVAALRNV